MAKSYYADAKPSYYAEGERRVPKTRTKPDYYVGAKKDYHVSRPLREERAVVLSSRPFPGQQLLPATPADILFNTVWQYKENGWSIASRAYARAMHGSGINVHLSSWFPMPPALDSEVQREVGHLANHRTSSCRLHVYSTMFDRASKMAGVLNSLCDVRPPRAFMTMFERRQVEPEIIGWLNRLQGVWVPCRMNKEVLEKSGAANVVRIPIPFFDGDPLLTVRPRRREHVVFYWIGVVEPKVWNPRKAPENIVRAFMMAFKPGEAQLVMKQACSGAHEGVVDIIRLELLRPETIRNGWTAENHSKSILVLSHLMSNLEITQLHEHGDVYVSASRGEGFDLPAFAAKLAGRMVIATASGGPEDFIGQNDILIKASGEVPTHPRYGWSPDSTYIDYKLEDLVAAMQKARAEPARLEIDWPISEFRASLVGSQIRAWFERITR